jgi:CubicO group peptidase (beta-lactamase class C family)
MALAASGWGQDGPTKRAASVELQTTASYFDSLVPDILTETGAPGAVVIVVSGEAMQFAKGYGFANVRQQGLVDAAETAFRVASVTKLLTTIAALQLVERDKLTLDEPIHPSTWRAGASNEVCNTDHPATST